MSLIPPLPLSFPHAKTSFLASCIQFPFFAPRPPLTRTSTHVHVPRKPRHRQDSSNTKKLVVSTSQDAGGPIHHWEEAVIKPIYDRLTAPKRVFDGSKPTAKRTKSRKPVAARKAQVVESAAVQQDPSTMLSVHAQRPAETPVRYLYYSNVFSSD